MKNKENKAKTKELKSIITAMDVNGDGEVNIEDIIVLGLKVPGIGISRSDFLTKELSKKFPAKTVEKAILTTPAEAGIPTSQINKIADSVISFERNCVTGISAALGTTGGVAMVATIPADIIQYYGYMLRAAQKLMYLYGFPEIETKENEHGLDSETLNVLILCLGAMYGVAGANNSIKTIANAFAKGVEKKLINTALTKGAIYPIVKSVAKWFGIKMTKQVFAGFFKKAIPVVGGVVGGGLTYLSFKPCCNKLQKALQDTYLCNPNHKETLEEQKIEVDFEVQ